MTEVMILIDINGSRYILTCSLNNKLRRMTLIQRARIQDLTSRRLNKIHLEVIRIQELQRGITPMICIGKRRV